jgi:protein-L-isoaspartate(D-aspartate) O-methyltransferase
MKQLRERLVRDRVEARGVRDPHVLAAIRAVPRELFVPKDLRREAYDDSPLPIGSDQTISQSYDRGRRSGCDSTNTDRLAAMRHNVG